MPLKRRVHQITLDPVVGDAIQKLADLNGSSWSGAARFIFNDWLRKNGVDLDIAEAEKKGQVTIDAVKALKPRRARKIEYPADFLKVWDSYCRISKAARDRTDKKRSLAIWKRDGLSEVIPTVVTRLRWARRSNDWVKNGGELVPGMQVWLNTQDFTDESDPRNTGVDKPKNRLL